MDKKSIVLVTIIVVLVVLTFGLAFRMGFMAGNANSDVEIEETVENLLWSVSELVDDKNHFDAMDNMAVAM